MPAFFFILFLFGYFTQTPSNESLIELAKNDLIVKLFLEKYPNASIVYSDYSAEYFPIFFLYKNNKNSIYDKNPIYVPFNEKVKSSDLTLRVEINTDHLIRGIDNWMVYCNNTREEFELSTFSKTTKEKIIEYIRENRCFRN